MIEGSLGRARWWFTDRHDGMSVGPYASANLALHVGDDAPTVLQNRARLAARLAIGAPSGWQWLEQVHGDLVVDAVADGSVPMADASVTAQRGLPLVIMTADCAPLVLIAGAGDAIAAVHAGWGGLLRGVIPAAVERLRSFAPGPIHAVLGPCIHADHYAFGADDLAPLVDRFGPAVAGTTIEGDPAFDVPAAVRIACEQAGVDTFDDVDVCTYASPDHFSHRRDKVSGRQALIAVRA